MQDLEFRQFIERVKLRSPIETVVGARISELRQRGALHWARCPFHEERTASFAVDPRRGTWRCFGACGEGGDVLSFVERFDGLSFLDALRLLARECGEELPDLRGKSRGDEAALEKRHELLRWAEGFFRQALLGSEGAPAREYLERRGLRRSVLEAFGVGWAPAAGQALVALAQRERRPLEGLVELGLARRAEGGRPYDFFRGRVLIPIRDRLGRTVGFGGRILASPVRDGESAGAGIPKYVNTPETLLFHKGRLIFGLDLASEAVRRSGEIQIVEGYTDVMAAHQAGWKNTVAVLGTATTEEHAALVRRSGARRAVLVFDGDEAGRRASVRALEGLLRLAIELRVAVLPEGRDPGDLLVEEAGATRFRTSIEAARDWFDWSLEGLSGLRGAALSAAVEERFRLLERLPRPLERAARLAELARFLSLPESAVRAQWEVFARAQRPAVRPPEQAAVRTPRTDSSVLERAYGLLIGALLSDNSLVPLHAHWLEGCPEGELRTLATTLLELHGREQGPDPVDASALLTALGDHPARSRVVALVSLAEQAESPEILARDQVRWIERWQRMRELQRLQGSLSSPERPMDDGEAELLARIHHELRLDRVPDPKAASAPSP